MKEAPMRNWLAVFASILMLGPAASAVSASTLEEKNYETSFALTYQDVNDVGKTTNLDGQWQWLFAKGHHELGGKLSYLDVSPDGGPSTTATIIGPVYTWNWMPGQEKVTGFLEGFYGFVSGDLSDVADAELQGSVGAKVFVGDSAAVRFDFFLQRLFGADGFDDQDSSGIRIGISLFGGKKK
jgi:hypothetical protein